MVREIQRERESEKEMVRDIEREGKCEVCAE
jgi:hypothetical protein